MAIYRGPGGAGDATNDATSQSILAAQSAVAAASSEAAAAASAVSASNSASSASTSATNAATSATNAAASETNAANSATSAATSATAAQTAETNAETAETNAETAETNAAASATAAASSAASALTSKNAAASSATAAATSATNSANSATAAATSEANADISESNAASSATAAASSASAASTSATNAASSASSASTSAATATTQASNAATSATAAATSATNAASSATAAASSATSASTSASTATTQATNAASSATSASSSASSAAASAAAAAASYDNFDDRYLGTKSTAPTLDNDGNALTTGALYYNDGTSVIDDKGMWVYDGAQWLPASAASQAILETYDYTATSGQTTFTGADNNAVTLGYTPGSIIVTLNGVVLDPSDYTATTGSSVVLAVGATTGDEVNVLAFSTFDVANTYTQAQADARFFNVTGDSISGNLNFTGTGNRITGDFSNATFANRVVFQTSTTNGNTAIAAIPNGTATSATFQSFASSDINNSSRFYLGISPSSANLIADLTGTGSYLPMTFLTGGSERLRIDTSGNIGIGTSSPAAALDVYKASNATQYVRTAAGVQLFSQANDSTASGTFGMISNHPLRFITNSAERMRIDSSGNLLVGTTSTFASKVNVYYAGASNGYGIGLKPAADNTFALYFLNAAGSSVGQVYTTGSATAYNTSSDYRLKENIQPMQNALDVLAQLNPVTYNWKADGSNGQGFIAHELQAVVPDCVTGEKDAVDAEGKPVYQGIDTSFLVGVLTKAIQELKAELDATKAEVAALKGN